MWNSIVGRVGRIIYPKTATDDFQESNSKPVFRDELGKKKKLRKYSSSSTEEPLLMQKQDGDEGDDGRECNKGGVMRVKVKMTKQEAARLLSKCKDGGVLDFKDAAKHLLQIPSNRLSVQLLETDHKLKTIHE